MDIDISISPEFNALINLSELSRELTGWYRVLPNDVVEKINRLLEEKIREDTYDTIGADGVPFQDLSSTYEKRKVREVGSGRPNLRYKNMAMDSFSIQRDGANNAAEAYFGSGGDYMAAHQDGDDRAGGGNLPQRKFFPETEDFEGAHYAEFIDQVTDILYEYLDELTRRRLGG